MARLTIIDSTGGSGPFSTGAANTTIKIDLDEALPPEDFINALGALTVSAGDLLRSLDGEDQAPVLPCVVAVPDDQVQAVADLNSGTGHPAGLLIIPASARRINFPVSDEGVPLNPDEPAPDLDPEQHFGNEDADSRVGKDVF